MSTAESHIDTLRIDSERLRADLETLASIGRSEADHGIYRMAFTDADMQARRWLLEKIAEAGLEGHMDKAANVVARLPGTTDGPCVMTGSHLDTVPAGGALDGALGVMSGLECLRTMHERGVRPKFPIELLAFSDEEGRFGGMLGSAALMGHLNPNVIHQATDLNGVTLAEAMGAHGLNAMEVLHARRKRDTVRAFLELHIEQGPVLERGGHRLGVVEEITGLFKWSVRLIGEPNHAGTTPMDLRSDAFQGLAEFSGEINRILEEHGGEHSRATIGRVDLHPGSANTVPGKVEFSLDVRETNENKLDELGDAFRRALSAIARRRGLMFEFDVLSEISPVKCASDIVETIVRAGGELGIQAHRMPSGAAHDAQIIGRHIPVGMIFIPSVGGLSHSAKEWSHWEDIENGTNATLHTLLYLSEARH